MSDLMPVLPENRSSVAKRIWRFGDNPFTFGGVGVIVGGIGALVSVKSLFVVGALSIGIAIIRSNLFDGCRPFLKVVGNFGLCCVLSGLLFFIWRVTPKPKDPPTAHEIARAIIEQEKLDGENKKPDIIKELPSVPQVTKKRDLPSTKSKSPPEQKAPTHELDQDAGPPVQKAYHRPDNPQPAIVPDGVPGKLTISQKPDVSTRQDAPYKTLVFVQSSVDFPSLKMVVQCNKPLVDGSGIVVSSSPTSEMTMTSQGIVRDHPNVFILQYVSAQPQFGPGAPLRFAFWSKEPIKCDQVATY
jgi:hypothetical protein